MRTTSVFCDRLVASIYYACQLRPLKYSWGKGGAILSCQNADLADFIYHEHVGDNQRSGNTDWQDNRQLNVFGKVPTLKKKHLIYLLCVLQQFSNWFFSRFPLVTSTLHILHLFCFCFCFLIVQIILIKTPVRRLSWRLGNYIPLSLRLQRFLQ